MNAAQPVILTSPWRRSSYCDTGGQCVELAQTGTTRLIRDSKDPDGGCLAVSVPAWAAFIADIKDGAYTA